MLQHYRGRGMYLAVFVKEFKSCSPIVKTFVDRDAENY